MEPASEPEKSKMEQEQEWIGVSSEPDEIGAFYFRVPLSLAGIFPIYMRNVSLITKIYALVRQYDMSKWYKGIEAETFKSEFLPLTINDLVAITQAVKTHYRGSTIRLTENEKETTAKLEAQLDAAIAAFGGSAFVKLNTRSPKDAVVERAHPQVVRYIEDHLNEIKQRSQEEYLGFLKDDNRQMALVLEAATNAMRASSGKEAMELLTNSSRVQADVAAALRLLEDGVESDQPPLYLIAREWVHAPLQSEFRVFICQRKITGAAQYFQMCYWPELVQKREDYAERILKYVQHLLDTTITYERCVIDVAVLPDRCYVIEINPVHYSTGAPMYGWKQGTEGRARLLYGPFELRVRDSPMPDAKERFLATPWIKLFDKKKGEEGILSIEPTQDQEEDTNSSGWPCTLF